MAWKLSVLKRLPHLIMWFLVPLIVWGCSDNSSGPGNVSGTLNPGSFEAQISGSETQNFNGASIFGTQQIGPPVGNIFVLTFSSTTNNPNYSITITIRGSNRPATGNHAIEDYNSDRGGQFVVFRSQEDTQVYRSRNGNMVITNSTTESLQGELTFEAELWGDPDKKVTVSAKFNANCQQVSIITCE